MTLDIEVASVTVRALRMAPGAARVRAGCRLVDPTRDVAELLAARRSRVVRLDRDRRLVDLSGGSGELILALLTDDLLEVFPAELGDGLGGDALG